MHATVQLASSACGRSELTQRHKRRVAAISNAARFRSYQFGSAFAASPLSFVSRHRLLSTPLTLSSSHYTLTPRNMGGNAFNSILPNASFPRMSPELYQQLKADAAARLRTFYETVGTPCEAPEKSDHGDIDFIVCEAIGDPSLDAIRIALGACHMIPLEGNRMSHFAIPLTRDSEYGSCEGLQEFLQVDVHVCGTLEEWRRVMFFNSYGDMGMIIGILTHTYGLTYSCSGLKVS